MQNIVPRSLVDLVPASEAAVRGAAQSGQVVGLKHNDEAVMRAETEALVDAIMNSEQAKAVQSANRETVRSQTETARKWMKLTRNNLMPRFGDQYSQAWDITGFVGSLAIPTTASEVAFILAIMQKFLATTPGAEIPPLNITAAQAETLKNDLNAAVAAVNKQEKTVRDMADARDGAADKVRFRLRALINELAQLIGSLDNSWLVFGFNMPGADEVPDVPEHINAVLIGSNAISLKWATSARAQYYRVWKRVVGVDKEFVAVGSPADLDFTIEALPNNAKIEIAVSAVNNGGETAPSTVITVETH